MGRPKIEKTEKAKRIDFTISLEAQKVLKDLPKMGKSKFVSEAIILLSKSK